VPKIGLEPTSATIILRSLRGIRETSPSSVRRAHRRRIDQLRRTPVRVAAAFMREKYIGAETNNNKTVIIHTWKNRLLPRRTSRTCLIILPLCQAARSPDDRRREEKPKITTRGNGWPEAILVYCISVSIPSIHNARAARTYTVCSREN